MPNLKATNLWATDYSKLGKYQVWTTKIEEEKATSNIFHDKYQPLNTRHYGKWDKKDGNVKLEPQQNIGKV